MFQHRFVRSGSLKNPLAININCEAVGISWTAFRPELPPEHQKNQAGSVIASLIFSVVVFQRGLVALGEIENYPSKPRRATMSKRNDNFRLDAHSKTLDEQMIESASRPWNAFTGAINL